MDNNDSTKPQQTGGLKLMTVFIAVLALHVLVIGGITVYHLMSSSSDTDVALDKTHKLKADGTAVTDTTTPDAIASDKSTNAAATSAPTATDTASTTSATSAPDAVTTAATEQAAAAPTPVASTPTVAPTPVATVPKPAANPNGTGPIVIAHDEMANTSMIPEGLAPPPEPLLDSSAIAPAIAPMVKTSAPAVAMTKPGTVSSAAPAMTSTPVPVSREVSAATPSGPVAPTGDMAASGPVHMPVNGPKPAATTSVASSEEHAEHIAALKHEGKGETYTVKITDSFRKIAHAHHITVAQLKEANHIKGDVLHAGEKLTIPGGKSSVAKSEPSHESPITGMTASTASLSASPASSTTEHKHHYYTVAKGDTLKKIAKKFDVTSSALKEANNLNDAKVAVGERLRIPSKEAHNTVTTAPAPTVMQPSQVETQPAPIAQPEPAPMAAPEPAPQLRTGASPELANMTF